MTVPFIALIQRVYYYVDDKMIRDGPQASVIHSTLLCSALQPNEGRARSNHVRRRDAKRLNASLVIVRPSAWRRFAAFAFDGLK